MGVLAIAGIIFFIGLLVFVVLGGMNVLFEIVGVFRGENETVPVVIRVIAGFLLAGFVVFAVIDLPQMTTGDSLIVNFMSDTAGDVLKGGLPGSDIFK